MATIISQHQSVRCCNAACILQLWVHKCEVSVYYVHVISVDVPVHSDTCLGVCFTVRKRFVTKQWPVWGQMFSLIIFLLFVCSCGL